MMPTNAPVPGDDTVPSAQAERRRAWFGDVNGIVLYAVVVAVVAACIVWIVAAT
jgi:hypothetical protein